MSHTVRVFAPATVANLGPGFDLLGLALEGLGDTVLARFGTQPGVTIAAVTLHDGAPDQGGKLPLDPRRNSAGIAATLTLRRAGIEASIELELQKGLPIGSGLGSSAASAVAGAYATNLLLGSPLRKSELIEPCLAAEEAVAGRHADNLAPALFGGLILIRSIDPIDLLRLPVPTGLNVVVVSPAFELSTRVAREALPKEVSLAQSTRNTANVAALVTACHSGDLGLLSRSLIDEIVTPARARLIPGAELVMAAARAAGALGSSISGSGPSIFALTHSPPTARRVREAMIEAFAAAGLAATGHISGADCPGVRAL
ncbi:MAG: homoserine kinase [Candidatus Eisenbacteria bacterium]|nr:homoserine kinase [Candidatus Eisenbacteria bacterium]